MTPPLPPQVLLLSSSTTPRLSLPPGPPSPPRSCFSAAATVLNLSLLSSDVWSAASREQFFGGFGGTAAFFTAALLAEAVGLLCYSLAGQTHTHAPHTQAGHACTETRRHTQAWVTRADTPGGLRTVADVSGVSHRGPVAAL